MKRWGRWIVAAAVAPAVGLSIGLPARADYGPEKCTRNDGVPGVDLCYGYGGFRYRDGAPSTVYVMCRDDAPNAPRRVVVDINSHTLHYEDNTLAAPLYQTCGQVGDQIYSEFPNGLPVECEQPEDAPIKCQLKDPETASTQK